MGPRRRAAGVRPSARLPGPGPVRSRPRSRVPARPRPVSGLSSRSRSRPPAPGSFPGPPGFSPGSVACLRPARPRPSPGRILWASPRGLCRPRRLRQPRPAPWFSTGPQPARSPAPHPAGAPAAPFSPQQLSRQCLASIPSCPTPPSLPAASRVRLPTVRFTLSFPSAQPPPSSCCHQPLPALLGYGAPRCPPVGRVCVAGKGWSSAELGGHAH